MTATHSCPPLLRATLLLALGACTGGPEGPPTLELSTETLEFGVIPVQTTGEQTFTITNAGAGELEILSVSLVAGNFDLWSIEREGPPVLAFGDELVVRVSFSPDREEEEVGQVQVRSDLSGSESVDLSGTGGASTEDVDEDGFSPADGDCDDGRADVYPGAPELCDGRDNNCDDVVPADEADDDTDGFRICDEDCDDDDGNVYPGAPEICDDKDSDCDGISSDRTDRDGDNITVCDGDCDDDEPLAFPDNPEICDDGIDNDCDGDIDLIDSDGDGHSLCSVSGDCDDTNSTIYPLVVDDIGPSPGDGTEATPFTSLDDALGAVVAACPDIYVGDGTFPVASSVSGGTVRIIGAGTSDTTLTTPADSRHFTVGGGASLSLSDLTISGGSPTSGDGGAIDVSDADLTLTDVELRDNDAPGDGGAVVVANGTLRTERTRFTLNTAGDDGGAVALFSAVFEDLDSVYTNNTGRDGGAVLASSSTLTSNDSTFAGNTATRQGGGLHVLGCPSFTLVRPRIAQNIAATGGGGISVVDTSSAYLANGVYSDNEAGTTGGGIAVGGTTGGQIVNNTLVANDATSGAGAIAVAGSSSGLTVLANIAQANSGNAGIEITGGAAGTHNTCWQNTGVPATEFTGDTADGSDENKVRNPDFTSFTDNGNPADDDLTLAPGSPEIDSGPPDAAYNDTDASPNDRGSTGGPDAL
jgi:hypothetical protein